MPDDTALSNLTKSVDAPAQFTKMSNQLGYFVAGVFFLASMFSAGIGVFFYQVVLPREQQELQNRKVDNETKEKLSTAFDRMSIDEHDRSNTLKSLNGAIETLSNKTDTTHELLRDIRDRANGVYHPVGAAKKPEEDGGT